MKVTVQREFHCSVVVLNEACALSVLASTLCVCRYRGVFACVLDDEDWHWRACECVTNRATGIAASLLTLRRHRLSPRSMQVASNNRGV